MVDSFITVISLSKTIGGEKGREMASLNSPDYPPNPSFALRSETRTSTRFFRSISTKEPSFSDFPFTPPRLNSPSLPQSHRTSPVSSPLHASSSPTAALDDTQIAYRCISSVLKKDGQILSMAALNNIVYTGSDTDIIRVWKLPEFTECEQLKTKASMVVAIEVSHNRVFAAYGDGKIRVWRRTWERSLKHVRLSTIPTTSSYVRSYIAGKDKIVKHLGLITSLAISASDDILYSASVDKTVKAWRIPNFKCIETIQAHSEPVNAIVAADDGLLYTASDDATVRVWRQSFCSGERPHSLIVGLPAKQSPVKTLSLTPDGAVLYGGCTDGYVHYWLKGWFSGQLQYGGALQGHTHAVMCLATAANYVVSGSADSTCRVWTREQNFQHTCLAVLVGHRGPIRCVTVISDRSGEDSTDDDGCTICSGSLDGVLKVWRIAPQNDANQRSTPSGCEYFDL